MQQHYASKNNSQLSSEANTSSKKKRKPYKDRSCLDILEKMFEPPAKKQKITLSSTQTPSNISTNNKLKRKSFAKSQPATPPIVPAHPIEAITEAQIQKDLQRKKKRSTNTLSTSTMQDDDEIFEITHNGTFGNLIRLHSNGEISPVQPTQKPAPQHNKITNYLIGSGSGSGGAAHSGSQEEQQYVMEAGTPCSTPSKRLIASLNGSIKKSPKGKITATQTTKLTKWFIRPTADIAGATTSANKSNKEQSAKEDKESSTKTRTPTKTHKKQGMKKQQQRTDDCDVVLVSDTEANEAAITKRAIKRRRLDLSFKK